MGWVLCESPHAWAAALWFECPLGVKAQRTQVSYQVSRSGAKRGGEGGEAEKLSAIKCKIMKSDLSNSAILKPHLVP
jgi:hypothetical protein